jgi:hypothetical protein
LRHRSDVCPLRSDGARSTSRRGENCTVRSLTKPAIGCLPSVQPTPEGVENARVLYQRNPGHHGPQPYPSSVRSVGTQTDRSMELREQSLIKPMSSCDKLQVSDSLLVCEIEADQAVERRRTIPLVPFAVDTVSSECHGQDPGKRVVRATLHQQSNVLFGGLQPSLSERDRSSESPSVDSMRSDCPSRQDSAGSDGERGLPSRPANEPTADLKILMKEYNRLQSEKLDQLNGILREFCTLVPAEDSL